MDCRGYAVIDRAHKQFYQPASNLTNSCLPEVPLFVQLNLDAIEHEQRARCG
jgi:hypothetical protein